MPGFTHARPPADKKRHQAVYGVAMNRWGECVVSSIAVYLSGAFVIFMAQTSAVTLNS